MIARTAHRLTLRQRFIPRRAWRRSWPVVLLMLLAGCSTMQPQQDLRAERIEKAVVPMARAALAAGQIETARRLYSRLRDAAPDAPAASVGLGDVELALGRPSRAAAWYRQAAFHAEVPGDRHAALLAHGRATLAAGDLDSARGSFARLADPDEAAAPALAAWGNNGLAIAAMLDGDARAAVAWVRRAVDLAPDESRFRDNLQRAMAIAEAYRDGVAAPAGAESGERPPRAYLADAGALPEPARPDGVAERSPVAPSPAPPREVVPAGNHEAPAERAQVAEPSPADEADEIAAAIAAVAETDAVAEPESPVAEAESTAAETATAVAETATLVAEMESTFAEAATAPDAPLRRIADTGIAAADAVPAAGGDDAAVSVPAEDVAEVPVTADLPVEDAASAVAEAGGDTHSGVGGVGDTRPAERNTEPLPVGFVVRQGDGEYLQLGAFAVEANARRLAARLLQLTDLPVDIEPPGEDGHLHRVRIGPLAAPDELALLRQALSATSTAS